MTTSPCWDRWLLVVAAAFSACFSPTTDQPLGDGTSESDTTTTDTTGEPNDASTSTSTSTAGSSDASDSSSESTGAPSTCVDVILPSDLPVTYKGISGGAGGDQTGSCGGAVAQEVVFQWTAPSAGEVRIATFGSEYNALLYLLDACDGIELACNDDATQYREAAIDIVVEAGQVLTIVVDGVGVEAGKSYALTIDSFACASTDIGGVVPATQAGSTVAASDDMYSKCGGGGGPDVEYTWTAPAASNYSFSIVGAAFDTVVSIFDIGCGGSLLRCNDDRTPWAGPTIEERTARAVATLDAGQRVLAVVDGYSPEQLGDFALAIEDLGPFAGDCCAAHPERGCNDFAAAGCVCEWLPQCCTDGWSQLCVGLRNSHCGGSCALLPGGTCCEAGGVGCVALSPVQDCVCVGMPECCTIAWDSKCVEFATNFCAVGCP